MNESAARRPPGLLALVLAFLLAACARGPAEDAPLRGVPMGGPFALTDQNGRRVSDGDFPGKYRLVYFGYTFCPDVCPVDMRVIGAALRRFEATDAARAAKVQPFFITVDPERDTPPVLRQFAASFHPRLIGLTGSPDEIAEVARRYRINYERSTGTAGGYLVSHTRNVILYGPDNAPIAIIPTDQGPAAAAAELERWVW